MAVDRKTRVKGNRVIHTTKGTPYHGDAAERPRGLTTEQAEDQRVGTKIGERQSRQDKRLPSKTRGTDDLGDRRR
jgi:hypothetical protein